MGSDRWLGQREGEAPAEPVKSVDAGWRCGSAGASPSRLVDHVTIKTVWMLSRSFHGAARCQGNSPYSGMLIVSLVAVIRSRHNRFHCVFRSYARH